MVGSETIFRGLVGGRWGAVDILMEIGRMGRRYGIGNSQRHD